MKIFKIISIFLLIQLSIFAQEEDNANQPEDVQVEQVETNQEGLQTDKPNKPISPVPYYDERLAIGEISFFKRYESFGKGEFLDVIIPLKNKANEQISYKVYVLISNEFDIYKKRFPGPDYKDWAYYKDKLGNTKFIENLKLIPFKEIDTKTILGERYNKVSQNYYKKLDQGITPLYPINSTFYEAVDYLIRNPDKALEFTLNGYEYLQKPFDKNEDRTIFNKRFETVITTHHYYPYKDRDMNYNKALILIFNNEENSNLKGRMVYKKVIDLKLKPKAIQ